MTIFQGNRALLDAFRRGDREALRAVYWRYVRELGTLVRYGFTLTARRLRIPGVPERERQAELVQETFARAFTERARLAYDGLRPYSPYLSRITKNLLVDEARMGTRGEHLPADDVELEEALPASPSPEEESAWRPLREAARAYCAGLDAIQREFVRLRFEEEKSQNEVAEALGLTRRKVRTLETTVREGLRRYLQDRSMLGD